ncbi:MAG: MazG nucleotide pyrophosphohydrolase domain-containing protein [Phenylobacterium sp.]|uniref:MazG nucleotide pyrophosphohydrolase domain-containing protein n=1 Tax=Phenylobacterium sp. TaxID=1871053 RepID=UPI002722A07A|nr:MazG nucleotide pyrophosphohydrolase domain-containing protein [Phenylobacterium sp.]MDO9432550.1 MazG nucleotide pyrophosphohydrolase domain-containing protein [Phenylobacterium sp.]
MSGFKDLSERAWRVRQLYAKLETLRHGRAWSAEEVALGFVGDVGDLAKLVQAKEGVRDIPDVQNKLAHELADCLWSVMTLARLYDVDLEASFLATMDELERGIEARLQKAAAV